MGRFDKFKSKITDAVDEHGDKISQGLEKAGDFVDDKTKGKYSDKIDQGVQRARDGLDKLDGKEDDFRDPASNAESAPKPAPPRPRSDTPTPGGSQAHPGAPDRPGPGPSDEPGQAGR